MLLVLELVLIAGSIAYATVPKESDLGVRPARSGSSHHGGAGLPGPARRGGAGVRGRGWLARHRRRGLDAAGPGAGAHAGSIAYATIPKESDPDVAIVYVRISHEGISPEDAERLLVRPMERELRNIEGLKELRATAIEGHATIVLEFEAGFDAHQALDDVREQVDVAKTELPDDTDEPSVHEVNVALFPVIVVTLYGDVPERELVVRARGLRDRLEGLSGVLEADIAGDRDDVFEVIVDPGLLESLGQDTDTLLQFIARNNQLVAAGAMDTGQGRFPVKVPALFRTGEDLLSIPVAVSGDRVLTFADAAFGRRTFKDPTGFARVGGQPAIALEVSKRIGANIIDTIAQVRALVEHERGRMAPGIRVHFSQDRSQDIRDMLRDLQSNVIAGHRAGDDRGGGGARAAHRGTGRRLHPGLLPRRYPGARIRRTHHQHRGAVLAHHGGGNAGRRHDRRGRAGRPPHSS